MSEFYYIAMFVAAAVAFVAAIGFGVNKNIPYAVLLGFVSVLFVIGGYIVWDRADDREKLAEMGSDMKYFQIGGDVTTMRGVPKADSEAAVKTIDGGKLADTIKQVKEYKDGDERKKFAAELAKASKSTIIISTK